MLRSEKQKTINLEFWDLWKYPSKGEKIRTFSNKQKLREFDANGTALEEMLKLFREKENYRGQKLKFAYKEFLKT